MVNFYYMKHSRQYHGITGVTLNGTLMAGFLNSTNLRLAYRASVPYISNPFVTMARTSVEVARRYIYIRHKVYLISDIFVSGLQLLEGPVFMYLSSAWKHFSVL